ncbi:uncharacterized protein LOC134275166 [Saccostrea cucullata]|uniref:uncharacterized protein LOC134275166 n=1 Tax=Saccostrea cuccullata TaxID=36930 RepID=UPI002ED33DAD
MFTFQPVEFCPRNASEVGVATIRLNCSDMKEFRNVYHCLPLSNLTLLVEFCYDGLSGLNEAGNCVVLENQHLNNFSCDQFAKGCPTAPYFSKHMYRFPSCIQINKQKRCYISDPSCPLITSFVEETTLPTVELMRYYNIQVHGTTMPTKPIKENNNPTTDLNHALLTLAIVATVTTVGLIGLFIIMKMKRRKCSKERNVHQGTLLLADGNHPWNREDSSTNGSILSAIYNYDGANRRFYRLKNCLKTEISEEEMVSLKKYLKEIVPKESLNEESLERADTVAKFIDFLIYEGIFTDRDMITMQDLMREIKRPDLEQKCIEYATSNKGRVCFFKENKPASRDSSCIELHVVDDIKNFTKLDRLIATVADIIDCDQKSIKVVRINPDNSFIIVIEMEKNLAQIFSRKTPQELTKLTEFKVDQIKSDGANINIAIQEIDFQTKSTIGKMTPTQYDYRSDAEEEGKSASNDQPSTEKPKQIFSKQQADLQTKSTIEKMPHKEYDYLSDAEEKDMSASQPSTEKPEQISSEQQADLQTKSTIEKMPHKEYDYLSDAEEKDMSASQPSTEKPEQISSEQQADLQTKSTIEMMPHKEYDYLSDAEEKVMSASNDQRRTAKTDQISSKQHLDSSAVCTSSITVPKLDQVCHISCVTSGRLWVSDYSRLLQVDYNGHVIQEMENDDQYSFIIGAHSVTENGDLIFVNGYEVQKMVLDGTIITLLSEREWLNCIHSSRINGDILIGYEHGVLRCDWRGNHRIELEFGFNYPTFITENKNGDIWVSDRFGEEVVVMDKSGRHRFNYRGQHQSGFHPSGICTDILGQVLVCDTSNSSVHLLDQDGQFLRLLLTREYELDFPMALCVDDKHNLYVGDMLSNTISVYKYLQETEDSKSCIVESKKE